MSRQRVRFTDPEVQEVLGDFLDGSQSWDRFFAAADALSALDPDEILRVQAALVEAVVAGRYGGVPRDRAPVAFLDDDGLLPDGIRFGRVVSREDDLAYALADLDALRAAKGERAARRWVREIREGDGRGYHGHIALMTVLPRAYRLRTGRAMPGYRAYRQEEERAPGARSETRTALLEVEHDGVPGLIAIEESNSSDFQFEDGLHRDVAALRALFPFSIRASRLGDPLSISVDRDRRAARDGIVLFRGALDAPPSDEVWVAAARSAMLRPPKQGRPLPAAAIWTVIESAGPGDPDLLAEALTARLVTWSPVRIRAFDAGLRALLGRLDRTDLLEAATGVLGWLSEDAWEDVRLGVIAQGEAAYASALSEPAGFDWSSVEPGELLLSAASDAHEERTDERIDVEVEPSGAWTGAFVVSRRGGELCLRWWADGSTARERHLTAEGSRTEVLAVRPDLDRARLRDAVLFIAPGPLL